MKGLLGILLGAAIAALAGSAAFAEELNFGIISTEFAAEFAAEMGAVPEGHGGTDGLEVRPFFASDYAGVIEGMRFGKVQLAWYGNKSAMEAVDRADGEIFVQTVELGRQSRLLVAHPGAEGQPAQFGRRLLKCDKSLNFGLGDVNSTSGFLVPTTFVFAANKVDPKRASRTSPTPITRPTRWRWPTARSTRRPTTPRTWR